MRAGPGPEAPRCRRERDGDDPEGQRETVGSLGRSRTACKRDGFGRAGCGWGRPKGRPQAPGSKASAEDPGVKARRASARRVGLLGHGPHGGRAADFGRQCQPGRSPGRQGFGHGKARPRRDRKAAAESVESGPQGRLSVDRETPRGSRFGAARSGFSSWGRQANRGSFSRGVCVGAVRSPSGQPVVATLLLNRTHIPAPTR